MADLLNGSSRTRRGKLVALVAGGAKLGLVTKTLFWREIDDPMHRGWGTNAPTSPGLY
jgi:hypothetical protein